MDIPQIALVIPVWFFLPISLILIYSWTRRVGVYHVLNVFDENGESKGKKFRLILEYNFYLSIIIALAIYITIKTLIPTVEITKIALITIAVVYFQLLTQRVLLHPNKKLVDIIHEACHHLERTPAVENYQETLISFIYSFINSAVIVTLLLESFNILTNTPVIFPDFIGQNAGHADLLWAIIKIFLCYITYLLSVTLLGESCLIIIPPEVQRTQQGEHIVINDTNIVKIEYKCLYVILSMLFLVISWAIYTYL
jgi:hypothetical protein